MTHSGYSLSAKTTGFLTSTLTVRRIKLILIKPEEYFKYRQCIFNTWKTISDIVKLIDYYLSHMKYGYHRQS